MMKGQILRGHGRRARSLFVKSVALVVSVASISAPVHAGPLALPRLPGVRVRPGAIAPGTWVRYSIYLPKRGVTLVRMSALGRVGKAQWFEVSLTRSRGRSLIIKTLIEGTLDRPKRVRETIVQPPGQVPLRLPAELAGKLAPRFDMGKPGRAIGRETVVVPAGRFSATHFRRKRKGHVEDAWLSPSVAGWPLLRYRSGKTRIELIARGTDARSEISQTPVDFDPRLISGP